MQKEFRIKLKTDVPEGLKLSEEQEEAFEDDMSESVVDMVRRGYLSGEQSFEIKVSWKAELVKSSLRTGSGKTDPGASIVKDKADLSELFKSGTISELTQFFISLIPSPNDGNDIFQNNARFFVAGLIMALVELRDKGEIKLNVNTLREYTTLDRYIELVQRKDIRKNTFEAMKGFMGIIGWQEGKPLGRQPRSLAEQFGYVRMYFSLALQKIADNYLDDAECLAEMAEFVCEEEGQATSKLRKDEGKDEGVLPVRKKLWSKEKIGA